MAYHVNTITGGSMNLSTPGFRHPETWYKYEGDSEWRTINLEGEIKGSVVYDDEGVETIFPTSQIPDIN